MDGPLGIFARGPIQADSSSFLMNNEGSKKAKATQTNTVAYVKFGP